jgi:hypothetical protein
VAQTLDDREELVTHRRVAIERLTPPLRALQLA